MYIVWDRPRFSPYTFLFTALFTPADSVLSYLPRRTPTPTPNPGQDERLSELVETLRAKLEEASLSLSGMEEERVRLERQVEAREEEIARLGRQIGSDSNLEKVIDS